MIKKQVSQEEATQKIADLLQQGRELGVQWAKEMLDRQQRAISIGKGAIGSMFDRAKAIVSGIVDRVAQAVSDIDVEDNDESAVEDVIDDLVSSMPDMIAGTEMQTAVESAVYDELAAQDVLPTVVWVTEPGACQLCRDNEQMGVVPLGTSFADGSSYPPAHPNCRCHLEMPFF